MVVFSEWKAQTPQRLLLKLGRGLTRKTPSCQKFKTVF
ncbi:hypothetical protein MICA_2255 [Micavibrio aeruginosavorus ARL-13]|uniref:Uncharacterized protein n=1 Tax=Micavibrio aeruginosavorus (strain ARL-13) TaxID=856793 RepID=G2KS50_MICAA|nr:hypothetical protein MICA_2255 [Micavibrio aeruginosavorus ARL-13]